MILTGRRERVRGNVRLEFVCGFRSLHRASHDFKLLTKLARTANVPVAQLPAAVDAAFARLAAAEKEQLRLTVELARRDGRAHWQNCETSQDGLRRMAVEAESLNEGARALAHAYIEGGRAALVITCAEPPSLLFAASSDSGLNAGAVLKKALQAYGGRGGGSATLAQGTVPDSADLRPLAQHLFTLEA